MRPEILNPLFCSIDTLKGIGSKYLKLVANLVGGTNIVNLLWHLPYNIIDRRYTSTLGQIESGKIWTGVVTVTQHLPPKTKRQPYRIVCDDETGDITLNFFKYYDSTIKKQFPLGAKKLISGRTERFNGQLHMNHPDYIADPDMLSKIQGIERVYPLSAGITNKMLISLEDQALLRLPFMPEWCDANFIKQNNFPSFNQALFAAHHPCSAADLSPEAPARKRLAYDELLANQLSLAIARERQNKKAGRIIQGDFRLRGKLLNCLGFDLTNAQKKVLEEIYQDQSLPYQALRLIQGDVGCGKTVVAMMAMLNAVECHGQAAIMAPTEILAKQHAQTFENWAEKIGIKTAFLTSKIKGKKRREILEKLESGAIDILIGTHALFTDDVIFKDLAFIVVDEQHRFGVEQRLKLSLKGNRPDIVVMTATPIPRTLVLTQFGDMNYSKIDELPKGRKPVDTRIIPISKIGEIVSGLKRKINEGAQAYWVCPLIEESEKSDLAAAEARFEDLQKIFGTLVGMIHGKMKEAEKDAVMAQFQTGQIKVLVSTTVVEVGVNVPKATVMIIERAERFGLAQLHQLRGRIKRGSQAGNCLLLYGYPLSAVAKERLNIMRRSEDGFLIAQKDLDLRGGGEILGVKQSGFEEFKLANLEFHKELLYTAHKDSQMILAQDANLKSPRGQALRLLLYLFEKDKDFKTYKA